MPTTVLAGTLHCTVAKYALHTSVLSLCKLAGTLLSLSVSCMIHELDKSTIYWEVTQALSILAVLGMLYNLRPK